MKIALAQLNYTINDFEFNKKKIIDAVLKAKSQSVDLIVFSELSVCGYPAHDLLDRKNFITRCAETVNEITPYCKGITAIIGAPSINRNRKGKMLFNSAFVISNGQISSTHHKTLLPTYDIFDEYRYFEPNYEFQIAEISGRKVAVTVCEDLWDDQPVSSSFGRGQLYRTSPMDKLIPFKPEVVINIAASPFSFNIEERRLAVFKGNVKRYGLPVIYVNQVGANADIIFDGGSAVFNVKGDVVMQLRAFNEDYQVIDLEKINQLQPVKISNDTKTRISRIYDALILGIRDYFQKSGFSKATLGLSGGIDSAVTLALAVEALGKENIRVLLLPSKYSSGHSIDDAVALADKLKIRYDIINIQNIFESYHHGLADLFSGLEENVTEENLQARIRATLLMALSNKFNHLLLNTSNKSEAAVGYGTIYGDMCGAISVLGDIYKTDVYRLAEYINRNEEIIPIHTISKPPSAELRPNQKDSDSLPEYNILDAILYKYIEEQKDCATIIQEGYDKTIVEKTIRLVNINEHKRYQAPPILRVSSKAFGFGRKMPLVAKW